MARYFEINHIAPESKLPFPKDTIRQAIAEQLLEETDSEQYKNLIIGYLALEWFISDTDYEFYVSFSKTLNDWTNKPPDAKEMLRFATIMNETAQREKERGKEILAIEQKRKVLP